MSGTSMDGIDAVLLDCSTDKPAIIATHASEFSPAIRRQLEAALQLDNPRTADLADLDQAIGEAFAAAANALLAEAHTEPGSVTAIGSHGQTIRHEPDAPEPYSLQIGNPRTISKLTGIDVIADFRSADIEAGGQGAPLVPAFHRAVFSDDQEARVILNIGGIANITILPPKADNHVSGFDTGPGNTLMDAWMRHHFDQPMDRDGRLAASGSVNNDLLEGLLQDPYFSRPPPKSTGFEYFNLNWLQEYSSDYECAGEDMLATLCELTARSISEAIRAHAKTTRRVLVCGGGARNSQLMQRLEINLAGIPVSSTQDYGIDPDWVEAAAFAWLAKQRLEGKPGNIPEVTGACKAVAACHAYRKAA
jgi:anhydro-N-acetylmuramic acid kinase